MLPQTRHGPDLFTAAPSRLIPVSYMMKHGSSLTIGIKTKIISLDLLLGVM